MTTRPYLLAFAFCMAGMVLSGLHLLAALLHIPFWNTAPWSAGLGFFVFLWVCGQGIHVEHQVLARKENGLAEAQEIENARRAQALELAQLAAAGSSEADDSPRRATAVAVLRFFRAGDALGFTYDSLHDAGVCDYDPWNRLREFYMQWPANGPVLICRGGSAPTEWGPTWTLGKVGDMLQMGELPLPPGAPPVVNGEFVLKQNTNTRKNTKKAAAVAVVDHVARQEAGR